jgi:N-acetylglucosamine-6-phosphate deacetylase
VTARRGRLPEGGAVEVEIDAGRITSVRQVEPGPGDPWLTPGLIDLQVNGFGGYDVNAPDVTPETILGLRAALARTGTTTFVPTVVTAGEDAMCAALAAVAKARRQDPTAAAAIPFIHVEGPFISPEDGPRGAHPLVHVRAPSSAEFGRWQTAAHGLVGIVTLSPHWPGAVDFTREVVARGTRVAVGHTHASPEQIAAVVDAGATLSTHLGNGAHALLPRHPNYLWAQLADDRLTAGLIADGHHLPADTLKTMIRAKTPERVILVSDSVALAGMPPGDYLQPVGGAVRLDPSGRLGYPGTPFLAGSAVALADCVATAANLDGIGFATAIRLATVNPARVIGDPARGVIAIGARADLITFDWRVGETRLAVRDCLFG